MEHEINAFFVGRIITDGLDVGGTFEGGGDEDVCYSVVCGNVVVAVCVALLAVCIALSTTSATITAAASASVASVQSIARLVLPMYAAYEPLFLVLKNATLERVKPLDPKCEGRGCHAMAVLLRTATDMINKMRATTDGEARLVEKTSSWVDMLAKIWAFVTDKLRAFVRHLAAVMCCGRSDTAISDTEARAAAAEVIHWMQGEALLGRGLVGGKAKRTLKGRGKSKSKSKSKGKGKGRSVRAKARSRSRSKVPAKAGTTSPRRRA